MSVRDGAAMQSKASPKGGGLDCMDAGGTSPRMGEGRIMQEQLSRATQEQLPKEKVRPLVEKLVWAMPGIKKPA